ncbi:MAG: hypothetical protein QOE51_4007, partial [Actinoplanes sp.]|nr:hypothetical protein [Actinoplanes sp.]
MLSISKDVMRRWFGAGYAWLTPWRVLVVLGVLAGIVGFLGLQALQRDVHTRALHSAELSAGLISSLVVGRNVSADILHTGVLDTGRRADMDADVVELAGKHQLAGLEVWATGDGHLIYADRRHPSGETRLPAGELIRARQGAFAAVSVGGRTGSTFDVFLPLDADGDRAVDAVVEVLLPDDPINAAIARSTRLINGGALLVALFGMVLLWRVRLRLRRQEYTVRHDALTGLGNRVLLAERTHEVSAPDRTSALLLFDLDGFKEINATLGHRAGDDLLVIVAGRLQAAVRRGDTVVRLGGDEFAVLLTDVNTTHEAQETAHRLRQVLHEPATVRQLTMETEVSVGIAVAPQHGADIETLLGCADVAMYHAKNNSLGTTTYDPASDTRDQQQLTMLAELRHAITAGQLRLYYQPKCQPDGSIAHVEALVRWQHPNRGLLSPVAFMPLAERTSLIKPLTAWVIREATR